MKRLSLKAQSTAIVGDYIYVLLKEGERLLLTVLNRDLGVVETVWGVEET